MGFEDGPEQHLLHPSHAAALHRHRRRNQDQADPALGEGAARNRHPARRAAVPRRPPDAGWTSGARSRCSPTSDPKRSFRDVDADSIYKIPAMLHRPDARRDRLPQAEHPGARSRPDGVEKPGLRAGAPAAQRQHRLRRQIRRSHRILQIAVGSDDPRRHAYPQQGQDSLHRFRDRSNNPAPTA